MFNKLNFSASINWWAHGLGYLCPAPVREFFNASPELITIEFVHQDVIFKRYSSTANGDLEKQQFNTQDEIVRTRILTWLQDHIALKANVVLIVPDDFFLKKRLAFPKATSTNLRQVLSFELNRKTPFSAEQVYFDYLLDSEQHKTDKIHPELFLVPKEKIDANLELLKSWNIKLDAIRPAAYKDNCDINLIAPEALPKDKSSSDKTMLVLVTATCLLLIATLYAPIINQQKELDMLESAVSKNKKAAIQLKQLEIEKSAIIEQLHFLDNKRRNEMSSVALINEVTKIIPDDTWLTRFVVKETELQLQGESSNASSLIQTLETSKYFADVQFRSPVIQNKVTQKDKFHLSAKFTRENI
ncbi:MAG: PilN domain-containing protein [Proteobacteria bacterium]|nr:hypothetical protein [Pseudomonadota bacterium]NOG58872.1 PilN domain-containing protein [Pseudomonadota bacterium]